MTEDNDARHAELLKQIPLKSPDPASWPTGIRQIAIDEAGALGVDANGDLYWHGKQVEIKRPLVLSWWQKIGAFLVAASTVSMAITDIARFYQEQKPHPIAAQSAQQPANLPNAGE
jgi:hypothetical protein